MNSLHNQYLIVDDSVRLTDTIDPVIASLDVYFKNAGLKARVTSGLRTSKDQLRIIQNYLVRKKLDQKYPECAFCTDVHGRFFWNDREVYEWQPGWSALLKAGVIINPPLPAECLMDYWRNGQNKIGTMIGSSPHFKGTAFDIGGGANGIDDEVAVLKQALSDKLPGLKGILAERSNNCLHCDCL
jgi:hypothetical protein